MTAARHLIKLNPKTLRLDGAGGGVPDLTSSDIAAALGALPAQQSELLLRVWLPDQCREADLVRRVVRAIARRGVEIECDLAPRIGRAREAALRANIDDDDRAQERASQRIRELQARRWPVDPARTVAVAQAALREFSDPRQCRACSGQGYTRARQDAARRACSRCQGQGTRPISDRQRAGRIGACQKTYQDTWRPVYEWALDWLDGEYRAAAAGLRKAVG